MPSDGNENWSGLRGLLREISWEGKTVKRYRLGGQGVENVLTVEALQALDFLPRTAFLGSVVAAAHEADRARERIVEEIESAKMDLLPGPHYLARSGRGLKELVVQPDAVVTSPNCYVLVEAKRIRSSSFQPEQLAREYALVLRSAKERNADTALLLLVLGENLRCMWAERDVSFQRTPFAGICRPCVTAASPTVWSLTTCLLVSRKRSLGSHGAR